MPMYFKTCTALHWTSRQFQSERDYKERNAGQLMALD